MSSLGWNGLGGFANEGSGTVELTRGKILSPVESIDLPLPEGYLGFELKLFGFWFNVDESIAFAFSQDHGASFINDSVHTDSYLLSGCAFAGADGSNNTQSRYPDSLINTFLNVNSQVGVKVCQQGSFSFSVGSSAEVPAGTLLGLGAGDTGSAISPSLFAAAVNLAATVVPPLAPVNLLRMLPYGNGDCNPPTSHHTIVAGSYVLLGTKL